MKHVHKSVLIWYSAQEMFALVTDVGSYPEFLPWCDHATVLQSTDTGMTAQIGLSFGGIHQTFTTQNEHTPGRAVAMKLVDGPFSRLDGQWNFATLGDGSQRACRVELDLHYGFDNAALGALVGPVFDKIAGSLVDAFVKRAEQVHGG
ncbi:MAG: type II toxin-antitoxin system RatA family toxin [Ramlibacter sp.]|nr:type II toxin-antitoxin system RatA family toxin [Ramlibacter sp.]